MPQKKYLVTLTPEERDHLARLISAGTAAALVLARARVLLKADQADGGPAWDDGRIAEALGVGRRTVERVRQRFVERGLEEALQRKPQDPPSRLRKLDGAAEAPARRPGLPRRLFAAIVERIARLRLVCASG